MIIKFLNIWEGWLIKKIDFIEQIVGLLKFDIYAKYVVNILTNRKFAFHYIPLLIDLQESIFLHGPQYQVLQREYIETDVKDNWMPPAERILFH